LEQVIVNLLINAFEAMTETQADCLKVLVSTSVVDGAAVLQVADHGPGISPEIRARIFDPFFTTKPTGMGMGLSICRTIVLEFGGKIEVFPNEPAGTIVRVALPIPRD
jgi:C4-dicarboxylate-specific signal transduction histidine kinase